MSRPALLASTLVAWRVIWQQRPARERQAVLIGGALLGLILLWQVAIAPAWSVWHEAPTRQAQLDAQTRHMLQLQAQAQALQPTANLTRQQALAQLQTAAQALLGATAQLQPQGEQVLVTLQATPAAALAQWLTQVRDQAQTRPVQAQLQQRPEAANAKNTDILWQGTLLMRLPANP